MEGLSQMQKGVCGERGSNDFSIMRTLLRCGGLLPLDYLRRLRRSANKR